MEQIHRIKAFLPPMLLLVSLALSAPSAMYAQNRRELADIPQPVMLTDAQDRYVLGRHLEILEDQEKTWTIDEVSSSELSRQFVLSHQDFPNFGYTASAYWVRFRVRNDTAQTHEWRLELDFAMMQYIDLYLPHSDRPGFDVKRTGVSLPFDTRDIAYHRFVFKIPLAPGAEQTIYLRFESEYSMPLSLTLWSQDAFAQQSQFELLLSGIMYGILLIMAGYNTFLWLSLREKSYLYYVLFLVTGLFFQFSYAGFAQQYLWPDFFWWNPIAVLLFAALSVIAALKFTSIFLDTAVQIPTLQKVITAWFWLGGILIVLTAFLGKELFIIPIVAVGILSYATILAAGIVTWKRGYRPARYFVLAWIIYIITIITMELARFGLLPSHALMEHAYLGGAALLVLLLSLALADRINTFKQEKEAAQAKVLKVSQENERLVREQNILLEKKVEERTRDLKDSEARFRGLAESTFEGIIVHDAGTILDVNQAALTLFGYQRDEVIGQHVLQFVPPASREIVLQQMSQKDETAFEVEGIRKDGSIIALEVHGKTIPYQGCQVRVAAIRDITLHKQTEETLRQAEQKALEAKEAAEAAQRASESANRAKSTFLANMSHELRTPLNVILGFAQIAARRQDLSPELHEHMELIARSGEHLLTLINQVLDLSKIEAGGMTLHEKNFDLYEMLADLENMFRFQVQQKGLSLTIDRAPETPQYICTDEVKLRQVLINLLNNAMKFTEEGSVELRIANCELRNEQSEIRNLKFEIEDTGSGIAPEELDHLFEAFVQTETGRESLEGTGLGLPISRKFVQLMGGEMSVKSEVGRGTVFTFTIQVKVVDGQDVRSQVPKRRVMGLEPGQPHYRILIVDDHRENRQLFVQLLQFPEFELRDAENGQEAVEVWESWQPHLIFMDIRMPVLDGYEATKEIRKLETRNSKLDTGNSKLKTGSSENPRTTAPRFQVSSFKFHTPIIAVTASVFEEEKAVALSVGCDDFIRKPFQESMVFEILAKQLGIRYVYKEQQQSVGSKDQTIDLSALTPSALAALPETLRSELEDATIALDTEQLHALIVQISAHNALLARTLESLAGSYRFDLIFRALEATTNTLGS